jgi:hypothetical protein
MLARLFPKQIDNDYRGYLLALILFVPVVLLKLTIGVNTMGVNPWVSSRRVITGADGIPLDTFSPAAQEIVVLLFAYWGLAQVLLCVLCLLALVRYRALVPLMYLLLLADQLGRKALTQLHTVEPTAASAGSNIGFFINLGLLAALLIGFALSIQDKSRAVG